MSSYKIIQDVQHYDSVVLPRAASYKKLEVLAGVEPVAAKWVPLTVRFHKMEKAGDFPYLSTDVPVFTKRALQALQPLIGQSIEALPLECESEELYAIHALELMDCLDHSRSVVTRFPSGGIMDVEEFVFKKNCDQGKHIFRLTDAPTKYVFVSDQFKSVVEKNKLRGLIFEKVG
jgi:hypothetical protein